MCQKKSSVETIIIHKQELKKIRVDACIRGFIRDLTNAGFNTFGCCCGHNRYPITVICEHPNGKFYDLISGRTIPRTRNFYRLDADGFYYIPEVILNETI
jgi:hypothetical protein